jgi:cyclic pyranopterin phosphate synthase
MVKDQYGRPITSIRIALTQRCNLHCFYCHREGEIPGNHIEMTPEEIYKIVSLAASFSVKNVKLTGGEPLLKTDILEIIRKIKSVPEILEVSMTTNGTLLRKLAKQLKTSGLTRVNVSLDTLDPETYRLITGQNILKNVIEGITEAVKVGLSPIKVNMVLIKGINDNQIWDMMTFARKKGLILQLIELESPKKDKLHEKYHLDLTEIENELKTRAKKIVIREMHHRKKYFLEEGLEVEVVKPLHNTEFCKFCNRLRITSNGRIKPCLFEYNNLVDLLNPLRNQASDKVLSELFLEAVKRRKPYFT